MNVQVEQREWQRATEDPVGRVPTHPERIQREVIVSIHRWSAVDIIMDCLVSLGVVVRLLTIFLSRINN